MNKELGSMNTFTVLKDIKQNLDNNSTIVTYMRREDVGVNFVVFNDKASAKNYYESLCNNEEFYSVSLCAVIKSTDYASHPLFVGA